MRRVELQERRPRERLEHALRGRITERRRARAADHEHRHVNLAQTLPHGARRARAAVKDLPQRVLRRAPHQHIAVATEDPLHAVRVDRVGVSGRRLAQIGQRRGLVVKAIRPLERESPRARHAGLLHPRPDVDEHERPHPVGMREGERGRVEAAHRVAHHDRSLQTLRIDHADRIGDEVFGRVALRRLRTVAVPARVRRDQMQPLADRIREEIPIPAVVPDTVHEQGVGRRARPLPHAEAIDVRLARHAHSLDSLAS